ncbi:MAG TPA: transposase [Polyangiaceae bacterium]
MARGPRHAPGGFAYHVLNRGVARLPLFEKPADSAAFLRVLAEALDAYPMRILAFVLMPNHWHFVLWPERDDDLSNFCRWLTHTHSMRWHDHYHTSGTGHIYQGRFKAFAIESDEHLPTVCRYVERNPLRANLVQRAEHWRWSSLWRRVHGDEQPRPFLAPGPVPVPADWVERVNAAQTEAELAAFRRALQRGSPFGSAVWREQMASRLGLSHTLRSVGRPKKALPEERCS